MSFKEIVLPSCSITEVRKIPSLNNFVDATNFVKGLPQQKLRSLWDRMSKTHRENVRKKNIIITYEHEKIDSNGYSIIMGTPRKVLNYFILFVV
jgi:hypothetical protein